MKYQPVIMSSMLQKEGEYIIYWGVVGIFHLPTHHVQCV